MYSPSKEPLNKWTRADCEEICVIKRRKSAGILTDFKILQRIYGANLPQGAEVHLFRGSLNKDGKFPLTAPCKIAAYGGGVRHTLKGGTGSGEVNSRFFVTVEQGLRRIIVMERPIDGGFERNKNHKEVCIC